MRTQNDYSYNKKERVIARYFSTRLFICILLFIFCLLIKFYPNDSFVKVNKSISLIVSENTDIKATYEKIKSLFVRDKSLETLSPVSYMTPPSTGKIVKGFGVQDASSSDFHYGVDITTEESENIVSANDGKVLEIASNDEYGSFIIIRHSDEITTLYGNLNEILTNVGDEIKAGQPIARAGGEDRTFYFELRRGDTYLDPTEFIDFKE